MSARHMSAQIAAQTARTHPAIGVTVGRNGVEHRVVGVKRGPVYGDFSDMDAPSIPLRGTLYLTIESPDGKRSKVGPFDADDVLKTAEAQKATGAQP